MNTRTFSTFLTALFLLALGTTALAQAPQKTGKVTIATPSKMVISKIKISEGDAYDIRSKAILTLTAANSDDTVTGNPDRLVQVFVNLLRNALNAVEPGGNISVISRRFVRDGHYLLHDDGRLYDITNDLLENHDLSASTQSEAVAARKRLQLALDRCK